MRKEISEEDIEQIKKTAKWEIEIYGECTNTTSLELLEVIEQLESEAEYNGYYNAYLLGMTTKEEFEEISKKFVVI